MDGLKLEDFNSHESCNENTMKEILELAKNYSKSIEVGTTETLICLVFSIMPYTFCSCLFHQCE